MGAFKAIETDSAEQRRTYLTTAGVLVLTIALADWLIVPNIALGFLYIFPIMLAAPFLTRSQILLLAAVCTVLRQRFAPGSIDFESIPRGIAVMTAFSGVGLYVREIARNRSNAVRDLKEIQRQALLRQQAEEQVNILIESSPMAILIVDWRGSILLANSAAHRMLGTADTNIAQETITSFLPVLEKFQRSGMPSRVFRTDLETKGYRRSGQIFMAHLWLSTFKVGSETRLAIMVADESEELREREETALRQLLWHSRLMMGAVSHEMRNLCGAMGVVHANLARLPGLERNEDFQAFGELLTGLRSVVSAELRLASEGKIARVQLPAVFENVRIVVEPSFREADAEILWKAPSPLPPVWAEPQGLTQVFLNISQNSCRALERARRRILVVSATVEEKRVIIRFRDTGPGVRDPEKLFQPFQEGATTTGMGLYVSRAIIRSFGGKLEYEASDEGACFALELVRADDDSASVS